MSIINMIPSDVTETEMNGAYCPIYSWNDKKTWESQIILKETHQGVCLREWERNGYDDSDFYMEVWDEKENKPKAIMFATTRGWSYPCYGSFVDATDDVKKAYSEWKAENDRKKRVMNKLNERKEIRHYAKIWNVSFFGAKKVFRSVSSKDFGAIDTLLKTKTFRSEFRKSLANQVRGWVADNSNKFATPLSRKQMSYL